VAGTSSSGNTSLLLSATKSVTRVNATENPAANATTFRNSVLPVRCQQIVAQITTPTTVTIGIQHDTIWKPVAGFPGPKARPIHDHRKPAIITTLPINTNATAALDGVAPPLRIGES
jgi:hypothetical protein